ncbi:MAG: hypothetical protein AAFX40_15240 [Cyanobacteria bacterium J06639_1]
MVGFIKRLFSGGNKSSGGAFYLDPDDAKTFGNIDYMRAERTVKRTFAKMGDAEEGGELTLRVSSAKSEEVSEAPSAPRTGATPSFQSFNPTSTSSTSSESKSAGSSESTFKPQSSSPNSSSGSSMDMFRNMAKDIKKRK